MGKYIGFAIALFGLAGMAWAMYNLRNERESVVPIVAFGAYALMFAMGVAYHGEIASFKGGPTGIEAAFNQAVKQGTTELRQEAGSGVETIRKEVEDQKVAIAKLLTQADEIKGTLENQIRKFRPRVLNEKQQQDLVLALSSAGQHQVEVWYATPTDEARDLAKQFQSCLIRAQWQVNETLNRHVIEIFEPLSIMVKDRLNPPPTAIVLQQSVKSIGYDAPFVQDPDAPVREASSPDKAVLIVGPKDYLSK